MTCIYFEISRRVVYRFQTNIEPIFEIRDKCKFGKQQTRFDKVSTLETMGEIIPCRFSGISFPAYVIVYSLLVHTLIADCMGESFQD